MKKAFMILLASLLLLGAIGLVGCGGAKVKVDTEEGSVDVQTSEGSVKLNTKTPTEAELGVPIYPNAKAVENASGSVTEGDKTYTAVQLVTDDPVATVLEWYKGKLSGKPGYIDMSTPEGGILSFQADNEIKSVIIGPGQVDQKGKTTIAITSGTGTMPQFTQ